MLLTITEPCLNLEFPRGELKNCQCSENLRITSWSYDMEGHAKKCVERYCELANKTTLNNFTKYQLHALTTIITKKKNWNRVRIVNSMLSNCSSNLENQHDFLTTFFWAVLNVNANRTKLLWRRTENVWITYFCWSNWKIGVRWKILWAGTEYLLPASMTITSRRRNWNQLENCRRSARRLSWNVCIWHEMVDLTFFGL